MPTYRTLRVNEVDIAYREWGRGETVIVLHSSASSSAQWRSLAEGLNGRYRILAPDLHGYGASGTWSGQRPVTLADEAAIVLALAAGTEGRVHLVGHSYGGAVALRAALERPSRFASLTLIEPVAFHLLASGSRREAVAHGEVKALARGVGGVRVSGHFRAGAARFADYWNGRGFWRGLATDRQAALVADLGSVALNFAAIRQEATTVADYRRLAVPALVLRGGHSPQPVRRVAEILAEALPGARLATIESAAHMMPLTHSETVNGHIAEHLDRHAGRTVETGDALKAA